MSEEIKKYDKNGNEIYCKRSSGLEKWCKYDKNNNLIHFKNSAGYEDWQEYDEDNRSIHFKDNSGIEYWHKWEKNRQIDITEKEYKEIEYNIKIKEYNLRTKCSRFELMDI